MSLRFVLGCLVIPTMIFILPGQSFAQEPSRTPNPIQNPSQAQPKQSTAVYFMPIACYEKQTVTEKLDSLFDERVTARGLLSTGALIEVLVSDGGTFTILVTTPEAAHVTCVLAVGTDYETYKLPDIDDTQL